MVHFLEHAHFEINYFLVVDIVFFYIPKDVMFSNRLTRSKERLKSR